MQKELANHLTNMMHKKDQELYSNETRQNICENQIKQLTGSVKGLQEKLDNETEALMKVRLNAKELQKSNLISTISYEA